MWKVDICSFAVSQTVMAPLAPLASMTPMLHFMRWCDPHWVEEFTEIQEIS